jgi:D-serine deaminase-like pyridoxal phosphate-dependent protein
MVLLSRSLSCSLPAWALAFVTTWSSSLHGPRYIVATLSRSLSCSLPAWALAFAFGLARLRDQVADLERSLCTLNFFRSKAS